MNRFSLGRARIAARRVDLPPAAAMGLLLLAGGIVFGSFLPLLPGDRFWGRDNPSHAAEIEVIAGLLRQGRTDFWCDSNNLGYPLFIAYQPLPSALMGTVAALLPRSVSSTFLIHASTALCWALIPVTWYFGGRGLGLSRLGSTALALFVLAVRDQTDFGFGPTGQTFTGLYTQAWGMLFFPLALGAVRSFVQGTGGRGIPAVLFLALCLLSHSFLGYVAVLAAFLLALVGGRGRRERLIRLAKVTAGLAAIAGFWIVPFLLCADYQGGSPLEGSLRDGEPLSEILLRFGTGGILDSGRLPWITALAAAGGASVVFRSPGDARTGVLLIGIGSLALLGGPRSWGEGYRSLPLHGTLEVCRYVVGLQVAGIYFAALAVESLAKGIGGWQAAASGGGLRPGYLVPSLAALLAGGISVWSSVRLVRSTAVSDEPTSRQLQDLSARLSRGSGRFLCSKGFDTENLVLQTLLPIRTGRPHVFSLARGAHDSLSLQYLRDLRFTAAEFRLYNIQTVVSRKAPETAPGFLSALPPAEPFTLLEPRQSSGYFEVIRTPVSVRSRNFRDVRSLCAAMCPDLLDAGILPVLTRDAAGAGDRLESLEGGLCSLTLAGEAAPRVVYPEVAAEVLLRKYRRLLPTGSRVLEETVGPNEYRARFEAATGEEVVLLKASYHPYWNAWLDGNSVPVIPVAPNLMAAAVPAGIHEIRFRYRNPLYQKVWFLAVLLAGLVCGSRALIRRRSEPADAFRRLKEEVRP